MKSISTNRARLSQLALGAMLLAAASVSAQDSSNSDTSGPAADAVADTPAEPALPESMASKPLSASSAAASTTSTKVGRFATAQVTGDVNAMFTFTWVDKRGVEVKVSNMSNFGDMNLKNYSYSINTNTVSGDQADQAQRCAGSQGRLDPANVTNNVICEPHLAEYCQLGDLSGKHGKINATDGGKPKDITYLEEYLRFWPEPFSILGRSVVVEGSDGKRLGCGNIISLLDGTANESGLPTNKKSSYQKKYPSGAFKPPVSAVNLGSGTVINTIGLQSANLAVPAKMLAASEAADVVLVTASGKFSVAPTSYPATGTALPTQPPVEVDGSGFATAKVSIVLALASILGMFAMTA